MRIKALVLIGLALSGLQLDAGDWHHSIFNYQNYKASALRHSSLNSAPIIAKKHYTKWQQFSKSNKGASRSRNGTAIKR